MFCRQWRDGSGTAGGSPSARWCGPSAPPRACPAASWRSPTPARWRAPSPAAASSRRSTPRPRRCSREVLRAWRPSASWTTRRSRSACPAAARSTCSSRCWTPRSSRASPRRCARTAPSPTSRPSPATHLGACRASSGARASRPTRSRAPRGPCSRSARARSSRWATTRSSSRRSSPGPPCTSSARSTSPRPSPRSGRFLGYRVTVCDPRALFITPARFPDADELVTEWPHDFLDHAPVDERTAICVLTHDEKFDVPALLRAVRTPARLHRRDGQPPHHGAPPRAPAGGGRRPRRSWRGSTRRSASRSRRARPRRSRSRSGPRSSSRAPNPRRRHPVAMKLEHSFEVPASPEETLALLLDAERVVPCMPGATLMEVVDDRTWKAKMGVKLGPVGMQFLVDVKLLDRDEASHTVRLGVSGRDTRGKGGAEGDGRLGAHRGRRGHPRRHGDGPALLGRRWRSSAARAWCRTCPTSSWTSSPSASRRSSRRRPRSRRRRWSRQQKPVSGFSLAVAALVSRDQTVVRPRGRP